MYESFVQKLMDLFGGQPMTTEIAAKIDEMRKNDFEQIEQEIKNNISISFSKKIWKVLINNYGIVV